MAYGGSYSGSSSESILGDYWLVLYFFGVRVLMTRFCRV